MQIIKQSVVMVAGMFLGLMLAVAHAQTNQEAAIKKAIEAKLGNGAKVDSVSKTPYSGLYEVQVGGNILYTDEKTNYLFAGNIIDLKTKKNLTQARIEKLTSIKIADMPLDLALKQVKGNGKRVIAVFEDANCGYCKRFRKELQKVDNITIYTFMLDILSEDSAVKSKNVWCSSDPVTAWNELMIDNKAPQPAPATCINTPHEKVLALAAKLHVNATPAIFFKDGSRIPGYIDTATLEEKLASVK